MDITPVLRKPILVFTEHQCGATHPCGGNSKITTSCKRLDISKSCEDKHKQGRLEYHLALNNNWWNKRLHKATPVLWADNTSALPQHLLNQAAALRSWWYNPSCSQLHNHCSPKSRLFYRVGRRRLIFLKFACDITRMFNLLSLW